MHLDRPKHPRHLAPMEKEPTVCIIGGGPAGLTQARALRRKGIAFTLFERYADFGGLWNLDEPDVPVYDSAHLISSRTMTGFADYPMPETWADYPSAPRVLRYIRAFAQDYDLARDCRMGETVKLAEPSEAGWKVTTSEGVTEIFSHLVLANGSNWKPVMPEWPGGFSGALRHGARYRSADELKDQRILIVGLGNSGVDIACDAARVASHVRVSVRRGYHLIPKHILGMPADVFASKSNLPFAIRQRIFGVLLKVLMGDLGRFGMPKPDHRIMETHPLLNDQFVHHLRHGDLSLAADIDRLDGRTVRFKDGEEDEFDQIICATGFDWEAPFLPDGVLEFDRGRVVHPLCLYTPRPDLFTLSFVESNGSSFSLFEEMAQVIACTIADTDPRQRDKLASLLSENAWDVLGGLRMQGTDRHVGYVDNRTYRKALRTLRKQMGWPVDVPADPPGVYSCV